jgi:hypothetical protein
MKILAYKPTPSGGGNTVAYVDVEIVAGVRLYGLRFSTLADGTHRVFGERVGLDRAVVNAIAAAAISLGGDRLDPRAS